MKVAALLVVVWCVAAVQSAEDESGATYRLCGAVLTKARLDVCEWVSKTANAVKRSAAQLHYGHEPNYSGLQWLMPRAALTALRARGKRQIADECCIKPCTIDELITYCY